MRFFAKSPGANGLSPFHSQKIKGRLTHDPKLARPLLSGQPLNDCIALLWQGDNNK